jgi:putative Mg2+ transporter-C (MgtC) family protein
MLALEILFIPALFASLISGIVIGKERHKRGKPTGVGTFTLVTISACAFAFISSVVDPLSTSRIAANILTGVGFLSGGVLITRNNTVSNTTTAAAIWICAAIGMAFGYQMYLVGFSLLLVDIIVCKLKNSK